MFEFIFYLVVLLYDYLYIARLGEHSNRKLNFLWISKIIFKKQKSGNPVDCHWRIVGVLFEIISFYHPLSVILVLLLLVTNI